MTAENLKEVREFNRFYTSQLGLLRGNPYSLNVTLPEARVLYEIQGESVASAAAIAERLCLDPGYLSRVINRLVRKKLVRRNVSASDKRRLSLVLTDSGAKALRQLDEEADAQADALLRPLSETSKRRCLSAMESLRETLSSKEENALLVIRPFRPGELGLVAEQHGRLYRREYNYGIRFEAYVLRGLGEFLSNFAPDRDQVWVADNAGQIAGSVAVAHADGQGKDAQLRWYLVDPQQRGKGLGSRLLDVAVGFAKDCGYRSVFLWTTSDLKEARRLYGKKGFKRGEIKKHSCWGKEVAEECWELLL